MVHQFAGQSWKIWDGWQVWVPVIQKSWCTWPFQSFTLWFKKGEKMNGLKQLVRQNKFPTKWNCQGRALFIISRRQLYVSWKRRGQNWTMWLTNVALQLQGGGGDKIECVFKLRGCDPLNPPLPSSWLVVYKPYQIFSSYSKSVHMQFLTFLTEDNYII